MATLDLTTLARLRTFGGISGNATETDAVLSSIITYVSQKFEQYCSRQFLIHADTERRNLRGSLVPVVRCPVVSVESVRASVSGRSSELSALSSSQYEIAPGGNAVRLWDVPAGSLVEVSFTGGLAADTAAIITDHPVLEGACKLQSLNLWQRHKSPDKTGLTIVSGDTSWEGQYEMLKDVKRDLDQNYNNRHRFL